MLGFNNDIFMGKFVDNKYVEPTGASEDEASKGFKK